MQLHEWKRNWNPPPDSAVQYKGAKKRYDALKTLIKKTPQPPLALARIQEMRLWVKTAQEVFEDARAARATEFQIQSIKDLNRVADQQRDMGTRLLEMGHEQIALGATTRRLTAQVAGMLQSPSEPTPLQT